MFVGCVSGFHKVMKNIKVSALLDGGFKPSAMCAYYGYSKDLVRTVQRLKKEGKSLAPRFVGGVGGRSKWSPYGRGN